MPHENSATTITNSHDSDNELNHIESSHDNVPDFLPSDMEDNPDCNQDCIFNFHANPTPNLTDDQIDGLSYDHEDVHHREEITIYDQAENVQSAEVSNGTVDTLINPQRDLINGVDTVFLQDNLLSNEQTDSITESEIESTRSERGSKAENDLDVEEFLENNNNSPSSRSEQGDSNSSSAKNIENELCKAGEQVGKMLDLERSVETSTETLVSDQLVAG